MTYENHCLVCGKVQVASYPNVICNDCRNPDTSTLEDFVAKLLRRVKELEDQLKEKEKPCQSCIETTTPIR